MNSRLSTVTRYFCGVTYVCTTQAQNRKYTAFAYKPVKLHRLLITCFPLKPPKSTISLIAPVMSLSRLRSLVEEIVVTSPASWQITALNTASNVTLLQQTSNARMMKAAARYRRGMCKHIGKSCKGSLLQRVWRKHF